MINVREISKDTYWIGANDRRLNLFENIHPIPEGVSYNSYVILDEKTVLLDTVDWSVARQFLDNLEYVLDGRDLDYMIINHMEPDHAATMDEVILRYPDVQVITTDKAFMLMNQYGHEMDYDEIIIVEEGDSMDFGEHTLSFVEIPMVHWPEAMVSFDASTGVLFSADAFGSWGALNGKLFTDEVNYDRDWIDTARRYYTNIVGKYGAHVVKTLEKALTLDIKVLAPLHGLVWRDPEDIGYILDKYTKWATYAPEEEGILIVYSSMYGNTESAVDRFASDLVQAGIKNVQVYDASVTDVSYLVSESFKFSHIVVASVTYNLNIYPAINEYLNHIEMLNLQNRTFAVIDNGSWAPVAGEKVRDRIKAFKNTKLIDEEFTMASRYQDANKYDYNALLEALIEDFNKE